MRLPTFTEIKVRLERAALAFDAWVNASLYDGGQSTGQAYERFQRVMSRFAVRGWKRVALDLTSEGVTIGTGGAILMLALAQPAFQLTSENWLKQQDLAVTFLDRYGTEVGRRGIKHDDSLKLDDFPDIMIKALVSTEDRRFYEHWGIDPIGTLRALVNNSRGGSGTQGGSSITQQLAKNLFLTNERSLERKVNEAFLALWLESHLTKNEILKLYLDRAYMGGGTFGAVAAADYYFGKPLKDISLAEAAMLAGLFKAPTKYAPHVNLPAARARAADVLHNMVEAGFVTEGQIQTALRNPATPVTRTRDITADYYLDWAFGEIKAMADAGKLRNDRVLTVKTPLDLAIQKRADEAVADILRKSGDAYDVDEAAMVILDPDGALRAMVGGADYGESQFNRATDALRQPGSSFKPYVYSAALASGLFKPDTTVVDSPVCIGNWCPQNYGRSYAGRVPMWLAVAKSINTIPIKISIALGKAMGISHEAKAAKAGRAKITELAHKMGITSNLIDTVSMPIGSDEVTVIDQAAGYAVFANGGFRAKPYAAIEVKNSSGEVIYRHADEAPERVLSPQVVADMNFMLNKVVEEGTGKRAQLEGVKVAGKSGTTNAYRDAWFVGYTGNYVGAVWFGNDDHTSTNKLTGGSLPAQLWHDVMEPAHQGIEIKGLPGLKESPRAAQQQASGGPTAPTDPNASAYGKLSRRSFEVISGLNGLFRTVERAPGSAADAPAGAGSAPRTGRKPGDRAAAPPSGQLREVAEGARPVGGFTEVR
ncbi:MULTISPECIES: PBP1A family penicillin-binding protein [Methylobacterium]|uniref:transglycosylase domain-containing protein n=1 Tax=Methylobacterium TaxID=407 RepID=UPI00037627D7|nr:MULTISPECIES: PBP1A family penicillin-binding protein [Methylobacterium]MBN4094368.1 PBP1A family penicillin-binding protein [Methylobacterium sp. OT2]UIN33213.1 PBP1A family penicillin-binding protein [Methylobacterium oryzae]SEH75998.1 penicillin-binding protein 1A [Methylobacterium sp. 275MFSha3.1]SFE57200.1 penicillin-binding protein 1A [Methylobacterium sp. 13MFTsu3.1M2]SFS42312.1 penicillin-binding protein 1A [Methylobacterium sp. yr668]